MKTDKFVSNCIDIALHHGFQGWLVNIENVVREDLVPALIDMVAMLADGIRQRLGEEGMVLWYDSVTVKVFFLNAGDVFCLSSVKIVTFPRSTKGTLSAFKPLKVLWPQFQV